MKLFRKRRETFEIRVQELMVRVTAPPDLVEESRAATLTFWEQLQAYSLQHPDFTSKRPIPVPDDAPDLIREMVAVAASAGVGPMFAARGAVVDFVGRLLSRQASELRVECGGDLFLRARKRSKITVARRTDASTVGVIVEPRPQGVGISTTTGRGRPGATAADALAVLAPSCMLAEAASAGVQALIPKPDGLRQALRYLESISDIVGAVVVHEGQIGVAGAVEIAS
ncbi:MAG: hypothetical protein WEA10_11005 [Actinomycetota bacterium]